mgnify:CR=1 FL=1
MERGRKKERKKTREKKGKKSQRKKKERKKKKCEEKKERRKKNKKIGTNFFRGKLETKLLIYPAWLLFHLIIFTAVVIFTYILLSRAT